MITFDEVNAAMINGSTVKHTHLGITCMYKIHGVLTRYSPEKGWTYSLELQDLTSGCLVYTSFEETEV